MILPVNIQTVHAGAGGLDPGVVASAILRGVKAATSSASLYYITNIRLVLIKINVFLAFKEEATQMFPTAVINRGKRKFHKQASSSFVFATEYVFFKARILFYHCKFSLIVIFGPFLQCQRLRGLMYNNNNNNNRPLCQQAQT